MCILSWVMDMNNQTLLCELLQTAQNSQVVIRSILGALMCSSLRITMQTHLKEYDMIETEALAIAQQRGWELMSLNPLRCFLTDRRIRFRISRRNTDSRIAEIMIHNHTKAMIRSLKNLHQYNGQDTGICILSQKLLDCETAHIRQLQRYL